MPKYKKHLAFIMAMHEVCVFNTGYLDIEFLYSIILGRP